MGSSEDFVTEHCKARWQTKMEYVEVWRKTLVRKKLTQLCKPAELNKTDLSKADSKGRNSNEVRGKLEG